MVLALLFSVRSRLCLLMGDLLTERVAMPCNDALFVLVLFMISSNRVDHALEVEEVHA
jgi:hypothetical protein